MSPSDKARRRYHAPARMAAAASRRAAVIEQAHSLFTTQGWSGTTIKEIAVAAGVSPKTIEATFGTKSALLGAAVDFAIRGDSGDLPVVERESGQRVQHAPDAETMLDLHATHLRLIVPRSARIVSVVEHAADADRTVGELWQRINRNRRTGVNWAMELYLEKPGGRTDLSRTDVEQTFWISINWSTYRTLTEQAGLDDDGYEAWLRRFYAAVLL